MPSALSTPLLYLRRRLGDESGVELVEFAVVLPVFILLILGILYFSKYENFANQETQLAEQGVRLAAVNSNPTTSSQTLAQYIASQASPELAAGSGDVTTPVQAWIYNPTNQSTTVRVCVAATVRFPTPIYTASAQIVEYASMHIEQTNTVWSSSTTGLPSGCPTS